MPTSSPTSSSAAATKIRSPAGRKPSRASEAIATALAATWPFMSSAPRPQTSSSSEVAGPRVALPLGRVGEHGVGVREEREPRTAARAGDARDEVGPLGLARVELDRDAALLEVLPQELGGDRLVPGRVDRVEPDQRLEQLDCLVAQRRVAIIAAVPSTSR